MDESRIRTLGLLIRPEDVPIPTLDTTQIHARYAALWSLQRDWAPAETCPEDGAARRTSP